MMDHCLVREIQVLLHHARGWIRRRSEFPPGYGIPSGLTLSHVETREIVNEIVDSELSLAFD